MQALALEASLHVRYGHNDGIDSAFFDVLSQGINRKWETYRGHGDSLLGPAIHLPGQDLFLTEHTCKLPAVSRLLPIIYLSPNSCLPSSESSLSRLRSFHRNLIT